MSADTNPRPIFLIACTLAWTVVIGGCDLAGSSQVLSTPAPTLPASPIFTVETQTQPTFPTISPTLIQTALPQPWMEGPITIGQSAGGRPLDIYRLGQGESARLIVAGIHGGYEANTTALAEALINHLSQNPQLIPDDVTLYILPNLNPDGAARGDGRIGRANDRNVDLNRNWPALWEPTGSPGACWHFSGLTAGDHPTSEPEVRALMAFIVEQEIDLLLNYHSAALGIFPGGQPPDDDSIRLAESVSNVSPYPYPPIDLGCRYTGQLIDWASAQSIPSADIELSDHTGMDWEINLQILSVFLSFD